MIETLAWSTGNPFVGGQNGFARPLVHSGVGQTVNLQLILRPACLPCRAEDAAPQQQGAGSEQQHEQDDAVVDVDVGEEPDGRRHADRQQDEPEDEGAHPQPPGPGGGQRGERAGRGGRLLGTLDRPSGASGVVGGHRGTPQGVRVMVSWPTPRSARTRMCGVSCPDVTSRSGRPSGRAGSSRASDCTRDGVAGRFATLRTSPFPVSATILASTPSGTTTVSEPTPTRTSTSMSGAPVFASWLLVVASRERSSVPSPTPRLYATF